MFRPGTAPHGPSGQRPDRPPAAGRAGRPDPAPGGWSAHRIGAASRRARPCRNPGRPAGSPVCRPPLPGEGDRPRPRRQRDGSRVGVRRGGGPSAYGGTPRVSRPRAGPRGSGRSTGAVVVRVPTTPGAANDGRTGPVRPPQRGGACHWNRPSGALSKPLSASRDAGVACRTRVSPGAPGGPPTEMPLALTTRAPVFFGAGAREHVCRYGAGAGRRTVRVRRPRSVPGQDS